VARTVDLDKSKFHLLAVSVAADLADVKKQGEAISFEAMNAKVLVVRAGAMALGFKPITDFMVELADNTIDLVRAIETEALAVSHHSVSRLRTANAVRMADKAVLLSKKSKLQFDAEIKAFAQKTVIADHRMVENVLEHALKLIRLLKEIAELMMSANAVAASARVEAAALEAHYARSFASVSDKLDECSTIVRDKVNSNLALLEKALNV